MPDYHPVTAIHSTSKRNCRIIVSYEFGFLKLLFNKRFLYNVKIDKGIDVLIWIIIRFFNMRCRTNNL